MSTQVRQRADFSHHRLPERVKGPATYCFSVQAEADPGVMPRVLQLFAKRSLVPKRWVSQATGPGGRELFMDIQVEGVTVETGDYMARCLRQLQYVQVVLTSQKPG